MQLVSWGAGKYQKPVLYQKLLNTGLGMYVAKSQLVGIKEKQAANKQTLEVSF